MRGAPSPVRQGVYSRALRAQRLLCFPRLLTFSTRKVRWELAAGPRRPAGRAAVTRGQHQPGALRSCGQGSLEGTQGPNPSLVAALFWRGGCCSNPGGVGRYPRVLRGPGPRAQPEELSPQVPRRLPLHSPLPGLPTRRSAPLRRAPAASLSRLRESGPLQGLVPDKGQATPRPN